MKKFLIICLLALGFIAPVAPSFAVTALKTESSFTPSVKRKSDSDQLTKKDMRVLSWVFIGLGLVCLLLAAAASNPWTLVWLFSCLGCLIAALIFTFKSMK